MWTYTTHRWIFLYTKLEKFGLWDTYYGRKNGHFGVNGNTGRTTMADMALKCVSLTLRAGSMASFTEMAVGVRGAPSVSRGTLLQTQPTVTVSEDHP